MRKAVIGCSRQRGARRAMRTGSLVSDGAHLVKQQPINSESKAEGNQSSSTAQSEAQSEAITRTW